MLKMLRYTFRQRLPLRLTALLAYVGINVVFGILGLTGVGGKALQITATSVVGLLFCGLFIVNVICDADLIRGLFSAPGGYMSFLTPLRGPQILGARALPILVFDLVGLAVGIAGVTLQGLVLAWNTVSWTTKSAFALDQAFTLALSAALNYALVVLAVFFAAALCQSFFARSKAKTLWGILATCGALYVMNLLNAVLFLVQPHQQLFGIMSVNVQAGFTPTMLVYLLLTAVKCAALFLATSYFMERKINI